MWLSNGSNMWSSNGYGNDNNHNGEVPSYDSNNHHSMTTQMQVRSHQQFHQAGGWGQSAQDRVVTSPAVHMGTGNPSYSFNSPGCPNYYNDHCAVRNSFSNQGPGHEHKGQGLWHPHNSSPKVLPSPVFRNEPIVLNNPGCPNYYNDQGAYRNSFSNQGPVHEHQGQGLWLPQNSSPKVLPSPVFRNEPIVLNNPGSLNYYNDHNADRNSFSNQGPGHEHQGQGLWHPQNSSPKVLPSPVFQNEPSSSQPQVWPIQEGSTFNNYNGNGFLNNQNHPRAQGPRTPTERYQSIQFTPPNQRPNFSGPRGRGSFPPNHRRGRGAPRGGGGSRGYAKDSINYGSGNRGGRGGEGKKMRLPAKSKGKGQTSFTTMTHVCDPCERWFNSEEQLTNHISEHRTCGIDGCKLTAHSSVVEKHIKMQHDTGLFLKMKDMVNSDDFAKWRAERKMRYPSKENIAKRQEEQEEKIKRGESIGKNNGRFPIKRGVNQKRHLKRRGAERHFSEKVDRNSAQAGPPMNSRSKKFLYANNEIKSSTPAANSKMPFSHAIEEEQILDNLTKEERAFSDTEWEPVVPEKGEGKLEAGVSKLSAALTSLASVYDSDSGGESEIDKSTSTKLENGTGASDANDGADLPIEVPIGRVALEKEDNTDCESPGNVSNKRSNQRQQRTKMAKQRKMVNQRNHGDKNAGGFKRKPDVSLLQKLLASEIRHERNVVLQCIRYIVENNFVTVAKLEKVENTNSTPSSCGPEAALCDIDMDSPCPVTELVTSTGGPAALSLTEEGTFVSVST